MTVSVIARVSGVGIQVSTGNYNVSVTAWATDGTTAYDIGENTFQVPFTYGITKANRKIREALASHILSSVSLTVDPEDIYFPFS